jgi:hypothetical protein
MAAAKGQINVSVANVYRESSYRSEIITQGLLGEAIAILDQDGTFSKIRLPDKYEGWISNYQWVKNVSQSTKSARIRSHFVLIKEKPAYDSVTIRDATIGVRLPVAGQKNEWIQVILPDGLRGWVESKHTGTFPELSRDAVELTAHEFLGYPYFWGGRSPKGFDCSGFTQTVFQLLGLQLPRDSWMQHDYTTIVSEDYMDAEKGDLYFFAESGTRITHVGIALGKGKIIHVRGMVRINSLNHTDTDNDAGLLKDLVDVRRIIK